METRSEDLLIKLRHLQQTRRNLRRALRDNPGDDAAAEVLIDVDIAIGEIEADLAQ